MNRKTNEVWWDFWAFESLAEGRPIERWWRGLPDDSDDHRGHIGDTLAQLQVAPRAEWEEPFFDPLTGENGISEIRFIPPIMSVGKTFYYRIYGFFEEERLRYTFLHATNKPRRNDKDGKSIAKRRLRELLADEATAYPFYLD
jgi:hypothetical protein